MTIFNKQRVKRWVKEIAIVVLLITAVYAWQSRHLLDEGNIVTVPTQRLVSLQGEVQPLLSAQKPTLVYFFAPWCGVCRLSINNLDYIDSDAFHVVRVALDYESVQSVHQFVADNDVQGKVLLGSNELKQHFSIRGYPTYYLVDENNTIIDSAMGYSTALGLKLTELLHK
ncbi:redoxin family protein [Aestuariibacter salexigens]|uniref:redoxin family protein n=1 Tax=Aestuariibacter salexigens TaxID=226010 RepID=UPI00146FBC3B|nr:redoxin family protein [Aestuariibacter salexigens]